MNERVGKVLPVVVLGALIGAFLDFLFNAILIGFLFKLPFTEQWSYVYVPLYVVGAITLSTLLLRTRYHAFCVHGGIALLCGAALGHLLLAGAHGTRVYEMRYDRGYDTGNGDILFRSDSWPQVLFVTSAKLKQELQRDSQREKVDVRVAVVSDYLCDRSAVVSDVAGVEVQDDSGATWTWQVDHQSPGSEDEGPGTEDRKFFWCARPAPVGILEGHPGLRPWEKRSASNGEEPTSPARPSSRSAGPDRR